MVLDLVITLWCWVLAVAEQAIAPNKKITSGKASKCLFFWDAFNPHQKNDGSPTKESDGTILKEFHHQPLGNLDASIIVIGILVLERSHALLVEVILCKHVGESTSTTLIFSCFQGTQDLLESPVQWVISQKQCLNLFVWVRSRTCLELFWN